ncbi:unnamed protein product [Tilletia controversa]|uniref:Uncharacterized protein n=4 Tax=Tilletia TaxID=13289 RepID=A0A8X7MMV4_9BASI|nr:hypothetical protein CF336_g6539 [Tilletia laevis]KAE8242266.1 hypothetical protein A4X06_0g7070 [Tilletia controversa]KAE8256755.1 hypothetical protein A4X03_0g5089 [Tilletia caries]CAD6920205.1 unnamed protein product [Tilletia controversa]CAD6924383.1 unnamed protein product [Tilletia laevis]
MFTLAQLANKQKAIDAALAHSAVLLAALESPFEDLLPAVTDRGLSSKLKQLSRSADKANLALSRMVRAAEEGSHQLNRFRVDYTYAVNAVNDHGYGKSAIELYPGLQVFPTEIKTLLPFNPREVKRREACLPLRFYGEDLSFQKALHTGRALHEDPSAKPIPSEENKHKVPTKTTNVQRSQDQQPRPTAPLPVVVRKTKSATKTAVITVEEPPQHKTTPSSNPFSIEQLQADFRQIGCPTPTAHVKEAGPRIGSAPSSTFTIEDLRVNAQEVRSFAPKAAPTTAPTAAPIAAPISTPIANVKQAVARIELACSMPFTIEEIQPVARSTGCGTAATRIKEVGIRTESTSSRAQTAAIVGIQTRAMKRRELDQVDILRYRQEVRAKTNVAVSIATPRDAVIEPAAIVKASVLKKPTTTKPTPLLAKENTIEQITHQRRLTTGPARQSKDAGPRKHSTFQEADPDSPGASPCARLDRYGNGNERRISALRTPPLAVRTEGKNDVLVRPSIKENIEKQVGTFANRCSRTPPLTPPPRVRVPSRLVQQVAAPPVTPPSRVRPRMSAMVITSTEFNAVLQELRL